MFVMANTSHIEALYKQGFCTTNTIQVILAVEKFFSQGVGVYPTLAKNGNVI
jgi:hypothetical protein